MPTINWNVILSAIAYAALTGVFNLLLGHKSQVEAWAESNPGLAAVLKFTRAIGLDPWGIIAALSLTFQKKLPEAQKADSVIAQRETVKAEAKANKKDPPDDPDTTVSLMPDPVREVAQERSRLHNDIPDDEPAEMSGKWRHEDWRLHVVFGVLLACVLSCGAASKLPCDESKLRAIDADYAAKVIAVCLPKYDSKEACPEWPALQVEHRRQLKEACP